MISLYFRQKGSFVGGFVVVPITVTVRPVFGSTVFVTLYFCSVKGGFVEVTRSGGLELEVGVGGMGREADAGGKGAVGEEGGVGATGKVGGVGGEGGVGGVGKVGVNRPKGKEEGRIGPVRLTGAAVVLGLIIVPLLNVKLLAGTGIGVGKGVTVPMDPMAVELVPFTVELTTGTVPLVPFKVVVFFEMTFEIFEVRFTELLTLAELLVRLELVILLLISSEPLVTLRPVKFVLGPEADPFVELRLVLKVEFTVGIGTLELVLISLLAFSCLVTFSGIISITRTFDSSRGLLRVTHVFFKRFNM